MRLGCLLASTVAALALLSGCSPSVDPEGASLIRSDGAPPSLEFQSWTVRPGSGPIPEPEVRGSSGEFAFVGSLSTPDPCHNLEAAVSRNGREVFLEVTASARPVVCIQVLATFGYRGSVGGLSAGSYRVQVSHDLDGDRRAVLDTLVQVR